jgi:hypothetical protein
MLELLLWVVVLFGMFVFYRGACNLNPIVILVGVVIMLAGNKGLNRQEAASTCEAIQRLGGTAAFDNGNCLIKDSAGVSFDRDNDRFVIIN